MNAPAREHVFKPIIVSGRQEGAWKEVSPGIRMAKDKR